MKKYIFLILFCFSSNKAMKTLSDYCQKIEIINTKNIKNINKTLKKLFVTLNNESPEASYSQNLDTTFKNISLLKTRLEKLENKKTTEIENEKNKIESNPIVGGLFLYEENFISELLYNFNKKTNEKKDIIKAKNTCINIIQFIKNKKGI